jgi:hypothetical protein
MTRMPILIVFVAACYHDPDYDGTRFKCGPAFGCPESQICTNGYCVRDSSIDASNGASGVVCNTATCAPGLTCCVDHSFSGTIQCEKDPVFCNYSLQCDAVGTSECAGGLSCCWSGTDATCGGTCARTVCDAESDCTNAMYPHCCASSQFPWKTCEATCT